MCMCLPAFWCHKANLAVTVSTNMFMLKNKAASLGLVRLHLQL